MKTKKHLMITAVLVIGLVTLAAVGIAYGQSGNSTNPTEPNPNENNNQTTTEIDARPGGVISYQGRLLRDGKPLNATGNITFRLYGAKTGGSAIWTETQMVTIKNGLFSVNLGSVTPLQFFGVNFQNQLWLGIQPGTVPELAPRQQLGASAYAFNLMPGATLVDEGSTGGYAYSLWVHAVNHGALYAISDYSNGATGVSTEPNYSGVLGQNYSGGVDSHGVLGQVGGTGNICTGPADCSSGIKSISSQETYGVTATSERAAVLVSTSTNEYYTGWFNNTVAPNGFGISTNGESYFSDYVTFAGGKSGYVVDVAYNDGTETLEKGDVVMISGYAEAVVGTIPVIKVQKATGAGATGVVGVVDVLYNPCDKTLTLQPGQACGGFDTSVTTIQPGQYLSIVTLGSYEMIKVSAANGPILPGDLLSVDAAQNGVAAKAQTVSVDGVAFAVPGTTIGKALGSLDSGTGFIPVFVTFR